jgi:uncharacterized repeat protein (TIGR01451 family)
MKRQIKKTILITIILAILVISQTVFAAPLQLMYSGPVSQFVYDNFDDNYTDPSLWGIEQLGGPTVSEVNQRLEITLPANSTGTPEFKAWYLSACQLRGDYTIQVDYELLTWPDANGVRIGLADDHANMQRISSRGQPYDIDGGPDLYLTTFDVASHIVGITPTSDLSGKLRLERAGDTLSSYYFTNGAWTFDASYADPAYAQDTYFYIGSFSGNPVFAGQEVRIAFDNMIINAGELVCPHTPAPDLGITQTVDQETVSTGDPMGFTITVTNNGDATANIVTLSDTLPVYPEFSWSVSGTDAAACVLTAGVLSCNFGDMSPGAVKTIRLTGPEYEYHSKCFDPIITSTATVMAYNQPVNKTATASVTVLCPYVFIDINTDTFSVMAGDPVSYTFTISNIGDGNGKDVDAFLDIQTPPGTSWAIAEVTPSSAASNCAIQPDGTWTELECLFDQIAPLEEVIIKVTSPTTSDSCGVFGAAGGLMASNNHWIKTKMYYLTVTCPVGDSIPVITAQPQDQALYAGDTVSFSAAASGNPAPSLQWEMSSDGGTTWSSIAGATASPLSFTTSFDQNGNQYRAAFTNVAGSATSNAATLSVSKKSATVTLANLYRPYEGQPIAATVITDPAGLSVVVTYDGSPDAPTTVGSYPVVATINDATYQGSASGTLTIQKRPAYVTPFDAYKFYGTEGPQLSGFLVNFVESDGVTATYSRTPGETVGDYTIIGSLSPNEKLVNYNVTYHTRTFTIKPRLVTVMAVATTKVAGEPDPPLTYSITSGSLAFNDTFSGVLTRDPGEAAGTYAIRQGTLALDSNYTLTYVGADLTILPASINTAPTANPGESYLGAVNTAIQFDGSFSSDPENDPLTYAWTFDDGATGTGVRPTHSYTAPGVYNLCLTVNDGSLDSVQACTLAVVYDPSAGFVTGGGSINSPAGAYKADEALAGKATFGFVSKYQKGARIPSGTTAFAFDLAGLSFSSQSYEWLVVNKTGNNAQFKGRGLINGTADPNGKAYKFMLWAADGSPDTFRIRIWWEDAAGEHAVYDNDVAQAIGSGNIVVHVSK